MPWASYVEAMFQRCREFENLPTPLAGFGEKQIKQGKGNE